MAAYTTLLSFNSSILNFKKHSDIQKVVDTMYKIFSKYGFIQYGSSNQELSIANGFLQLYLSPQGCHVLLRGHETGLITVDIHEFVNTSGNSDNVNQRIFNNQEIQIIEKEIKNGLSFVQSKSLPAIKRGEMIDQYYPTVDGRLIELDIREIVHDVKSKYQHIMVARSESLGNILILDGDLNMGESDSIYTHTLMQKGKINYKDKSCLILGGGDGGLLYELLNEGAQKVILVDIDEEVLKACQEHLRGVCHSVLDDRKGSNYEIIVRDAYDQLKEYIDGNVKFEYVLYDLTAVPVTSEPQKKEWGFLFETIKLSLDVLAPRGKFLCHATALLAKESLSQFEGMLTSLKDGIRWTQHSAFIPSFHEKSVFYEIWIDDDKKIDPVE